MLIKAQSHESIEGSEGPAPIIIIILGKIWQKQNPLADIFNSHGLSRECGMSLYEELEDYYVI